MTSATESPLASSLYGERASAPETGRSTSSPSAPLLLAAFSPMPKVADQRSQNILANVYKGQLNPHRFANGTRQEAIRYERSTGQPVGGRYHSIAGRDDVKAILKRLKDTKNPVTDATRKALIDELTVYKAALNTPLGEGVNESVIWGGSAQTAVRSEGELPEDAGSDLGEPPTDAKVPLAPVDVPLSSPSKRDS